MKDKYSIDEVSLMSGLTTRTIRNYLKDGQITAEKEDGRWAFSAEDFTGMLSNPYVRAAIKAKNNAPVFDFIADDKKDTDSACLVIDRVPGEKDEPALIEKLCKLSQNEAGLQMRFDKSGTHLRITLAGKEESVLKIFNAIQG